MSALQNALRPALTPALGSARNGVSRYFTQFDSVAQSYVGLSSNIEVQNSFTLECDTIFSPTARGNFFGANGANRFEALTLNGNFEIYRGSVLIQFSISPYADGKIHHLVVDYQSSLLRVIIDGGQVAQANTILPLSTIGNIGARAAGDGFPTFYNIISNVKITNNGLIALNMPINRYYTPQNNIVLDESGNGNNGTFVNIAAGRSKYYQQRADGNFVDLQGDVLEVAY